MDVIATDLFELGGRHFLVAVDGYSGYPYVARYTAAPSAGQVVSSLMEFFALFGTPLVLRSDGGPQYTATEFALLCRRYRIDHRISSAHYPASNGMAEAGVKRVKSMLKRILDEEGGDRRKAWDSLQAGLLELRATPLADGLSPAQWMLRRGPRTAVPGSPEPPASEKELAAAIVRRNAAQDCQTARIDRHAREGPTVPVGACVRIMDRANGTWSTTGVVVRLRSGDRSLIVKTANGRIYVRNRRFVRVIPAAEGGARNDAEDRAARQAQDEVNEHTPPPDPPALRRGQRKRRIPERYRP